MGRTNKPSAPELSNTELPEVENQAGNEVSELEKANSELQTKLEESNQANAKLQADLDISNEALATLKQAHAELCQEKDARIERLLGDIKLLTGEIDELNELNTELQQKAESAGKAGEFPTVKHKGATYSIIHEKINLGGKIITAKEIQASPSLVAELVEMESGTLVLKPKEVENADD